MKREGTVYVTIRRRQKWSAAGQFAIVRSSTTPHTPPPGAVEIPVKIKIDDAWFRLRVPAASIEVADPPEAEITADEPRAAP